MASTRTAERELGGESGHGSGGEPAGGTDDQRTVLEHAGGAGGGELKRALCLACGDTHGHEGDLLNGPPCPGCGAAKLRPDIVWFGKMPYQMDRIDAVLARCDLFVSIGTSGAVYPAAGFVRTARYHGRAHCLEINLDPSEGSGWFHKARHGPAGELVPAWVEEILR